MRIAGVARLVVAVALVAGGCARQPVARTSIKDAPVRAPARETAKEPSREPAADARADWCGERHVDHNAGKTPGGATTLEKKQTDDRTCGARYRYPGYIRRN